MSSAVLNGTFVCPGDVLANVMPDESFDTCGGCYLEEGTNVIRASLAGNIFLERDSNPSEGASWRISVATARSEVASETVIDVGDKVICRVVRISMHQASVEIISVGDCQLQQSPKGIIRREDVRLSELEELVMSECFRPGDIVRGVVISLGDSRQYYLSTSDADHGVLYAKNQTTGNLMDPVSHKVLLFDLTNEHAAMMRITVVS